MAMLKGETLTYVHEISSKRVTWKQGSMMGIGGDKAQNYNECEYKVNNTHVIVYIQNGWEKPSSINVDGRLQFGMNNGVLFLVLHDKSQKPYQHRFMTNPKQEWVKWANEICKTRANYDASWIAGDYLRDI